MYKITRRDTVMFAATYTEAMQIFNRLAKIKYPCWTFTRLYCDLGDGYQLMLVKSTGIARA